MKTVAKTAQGPPEANLTDGGDPALNFINTGKKGSQGLIENYSAFLNWCADTKLIDWDTWLELDLEQYCYQQEAQAIYCEVIALRNCIAELFICLLNGEPLHPLVLEHFNSAAAGIRAHLRYEIGVRGLELYWHGIAEEMNFPLWLVTDAAVRLIDTGEWRKIKKCPVCGNLFMDRSRNTNRRWCNINSCGSLQKSKKYYLMKKKPFFI